MAYAPLAIANTIVSQHGDDMPLSHMKLQKLVFYTYGWWLAYHQEPVATEGPEVWQYGPVFSSMYNALAPFGNRAISRPQRSVPIGHPPLLPEEATAERDLMEWVWSRYGSRSAGTLSDMTHAKGTPWQIEAAAHNYKVPRGHRIPDETIRAYFRGLAEKLNVAA